MISCSCCTAAIYSIKQLPDHTCPVSLSPTRRPWRAGPCLYIRGYTHANLQTTELVSPTRPHHATPCHVGRRLDETDAEKAVCIKILCRTCRACIYPGATVGDCGVARLFDLRLTMARRSWVSGNVEHSPSGKLGSRKNSGLLPHQKQVNKKGRASTREKTYHKLFQRFFEEFVVDAYSAGMFNRGEGVFHD